MSLKIYIPSLGRADKQPTLSSLPIKLLKHTTLVLDAKEVDAYRREWNLPGVSFLACPKSVNSIGKVRQFIIEHHAKNNADGRLIMLDDDLKFCVRRADDPTKFSPAADADVVECFATVERALKVFAHAGIMAREGGNRHTDDFAYNTRLLRALAYDAKVLVAEKVKFDRLIVMEDFDVALQLLRKGYPSVSIAKWVQDQGMSNASGGCSTYRTMERQAEGANGLAKLHPAFVRTITKQTKTAWGGQERTDVQVAWKKAFQSSGCSMPVWP